MPRELIANWKDNHFEVSPSLILCSNNEPFLNWIVTCNDKWRISSRALPNAKLAPKKGHGHCLVAWSPTAFLVPVKLLHPRNMLSKSMSCTENCKACSQRWSTERAHFFSKTRSNYMLYNQHFKSWTIWTMKFFLIHHIHLTSRQPTTTSSSIWTTFCRENASTTRGGRKCFPRVCQIPKR